MSERSVVAVVGGGLGGWTAAVAAAEAGSEVHLFEKETSSGGSTVLSGGFIALADTPMQHRLGITDSAELLESDLTACGGGFADPQLIHAYASGQTQFTKWLLEHGMEVLDVEQGSAQTVARSHRCDPSALIGRLQEQALRAGVTVTYNCSVTDLTTDEEGRISGLVLSSGERTRFDAVILATGGFTRSESMLQRYAPEQVDAIRIGGDGCVGDGLVMAQSVGAATRDFEFIKGTFGAHPTSRPDKHELLLAYYRGGVIVNDDGDRFVDESLGYKLIGDAGLAQRGARGFQIWDQAILDDSPVGTPLFDLRPMIERGMVRQADDLHALATSIGIDPNRLTRTISRYNEAVRHERADDFGRNGLVNGEGQLREIDHPPFYAFESRTALLATYCGLVVDAQARVKREDGRTIPGLFAVGEVVGGFHGASYMTGSSLGKAAFFGRVAGQASSSDSL